MDLDFNIEQGGKSDQVGKAIEQSAGDLANNINNSSNNLDVINNIGNLSDNLTGYTRNLTEMGLNTPDMLVNTLIKQIDDVLAENGVIDQISKSMQATKNITDLMQQGLNIAASGATIAGNLSKLMLQLNKMQDVETTSIPTVKDSTTVFGASLLAQISAQYTALKEQLIIFYNSMLCSSNDVTIDTMVGNIRSLIVSIEPLLDQVLGEYTGYTISEVRNLCTQGFAYMNMISRASSIMQNGNNEKITPV